MLTLTMNSRKAIPFPPLTAHSGKMNKRPIRPIPTGYLSPSARFHRRESRRVGNVEKVAEPVCNDRYAIQRVRLLFILGAALRSDFLRAACASVLPTVRACLCAGRVSADRRLDQSRGTRCARLLPVTQSSTMAP